MSRRSLAIVALALLSSSPALAADLPFAGSWTISQAVHAPWEDPANPIVDAGEADFIGKSVVITRDSITGPDLMGCGKTEITVEDLPYAGLFEGGLGTDPKDVTKPSDLVRAEKLARELGFTSEPVPTLFQGCSEVSLHLRDADTLYFGLNNRIFTMVRKK